MEVVMNSTYEITYTNESGCSCRAVIKDREYHYWSSKRDSSGKYYKVSRTLIGRFLDRLKNCTNVVVKEVDENAE